MATKKKNQADATLRNVRASSKRFDVLNTKIDALQDLVEDVINALNYEEVCRLDALRLKRNKR